MKLVKALDHARARGATPAMIEAMKRGYVGGVRYVLMCVRCLAEDRITEESLMDEETHDCVCAKCAAALEARN